MRIAKIALGLVAFSMLALLASSFSAVAHSTLDRAADTPLGSEQSREKALDNYLSAVESSDGAAGNALFRNPTCGAHFGPDGIHPPGNQ